MTTYTEHTVEPTLDSTLGLFEKMQAFAHPWEAPPAWASNGFDALFRLREWVRAGHDDPVALRAIELFGIVDETPENPDPVNRDSMQFLLFLSGIHGAYLADKFLRSRGIDPASL